MRFCGKLLKILKKSLLLIFLICIVLGISKNCRKENDKCDTSIGLNCRGAQSGTQTCG